jgi:hypothetical protein
VIGKRTERRYGPASRRRRARAWYAVVATAIVIAAATTGETSANEPERVVVAESGGDVALDSTVALDSVAWLSDADIIALAASMQTPAIAAAQLELQSWSNDTTLNLALQLSRDHAALRATLDSVAAAHRLVPQRPLVADSLLAPYDLQVSAILGFGGRELEQRFLASQREAHTRAIADLGALAVLAREPDLRALLLGRAMVIERDHLARLSMPR